MVGAEREKKKSTRRAVKLYSRLHVLVVDGWNGLCAHISCTISTRTPPSVHSHNGLLSRSLRSRIYGSQSVRIAYVVISTDRPLSAFEKGTPYLFSLSSLFFFFFFFSFSYAIFGHSLRMCADICGT